ncbi:MAG: ROK family protein, partial [Microbacterium sp.]
MTLENGLSIGVDVGGTNTDAVVLDAAGTVLASTKQPTADDVVEGIRASIGTVLDDIGERRSQVTRVMLGTTHATNAIVARRGLAKVAAIRLGAPAGTEWPPLAEWPADLSAEILAGSVMLGGGHMVDGTPITRLDRDGLRRFLDETAGHCDAIAVTGIFSPSFPDQ